MVASSNDSNTRNHHHSNKLAMMDESADNESLRSAYMSSHGHGDNGDESSQQEYQIAQEENKAVKYSRALVIVALLVCGSVLGGVAYYVGRQEEAAACKAQFENMASEVMALSQQKVMRAFQVLDSLSVTVTSFAKHDGANNAGYPSGFLTLPDLEHHFAMARNVSEAFVIAYLPLVEEEDRDVWEEYSIKNQRWIDESHDVMAGNTTITTASSMEPISGDIWAHPPKDRRLGEGCSWDLRRLAEEEPIVAPEGSGPYSPVWLLSPPPALNDTHIINYNMFDKPVFEKAATFIEHTRHATFLDVCTQTAWFGAEDPSAGDDVQTVVVQPVFEDFDHDDSKIVGHLSAVMPWNVFFEDILNDAHLPVQVIMSNTCEETFSYIIAGPTASLLGGEKDEHSSKYEASKMSTTFAEFANSKVLLDAGYDLCVYTINVYPTDEFIDHYHSNQPIVYVVLVVSIFIFTAMVFCLYDVLVGRRQKVVMTTATKTQALVSTLFPKTVQERILELHNGTSAEMETTNGRRDGEAAALPAHLQSKPIADVFPETTVMFGDVAGFTEWSSTRDPSDVFTLLEALYYEFDTIAKRRRIFKVETIGDCYVAVCGLPNPTTHNYINMARFASDCMVKMGKVTKDLESVLGAGTADLGLRAGLHSGPVTAGVLRGEKSRFQLFGDTMNTASRMESTGLKNEIQVSEATAKRLMAAGKSGWLQEREGGVVAKGKGVMTTFLLVTQRLQASCHSVSTTASSCSFSEPSVAGEYNEDCAPSLNESHERPYSFTENSTLDQDDYDDNISC